MDERKAGGNIGCLPAQVVWHLGVAERVRQILEEMGYELEQVWRKRRKPSG